MFFFKEFSCPYFSSDDNSNYKTNACFPIDQELMPSNRLMMTYVGQSALELEQGKGQAGQKTDQ